MELCRRSIALRGIRPTAGLYSGLLFFAAAGALLFHPISREVNHKIPNELTERRKAFAPLAAS